MYFNFSVTAKGEIRASEEQWQEKVKAILFYVFFWGIEIYLFLLSCIIKIVWVIMRLLKIDKI